MSDPILEEIWAIKRQLSDEAENMEEFCENLRRWAAENPAPIQATENCADESRALELRDQPRDNGA